MRRRYAPLYQMVDLVKYFWNIQCNTVADDDEDDEMDDEEDNVRPSDDVTPELETVIDLIEQLRQNRADEE